MNDLDLIAQFLEIKTITKIKEGVRAIESDREIFKAMVTGKRARPTATVHSERAEQRAEQLNEAAQEANYLGYTVTGSNHDQVTIK
jgi:hypothetical protein